MNAIAKIQMSNRRQLTTKEIQWKNNLALIWQAKKKELGLNQEKLADLMGWKSQGSVGQYLTGRIPLNTDAKLKFAKVLGVDVKEIDPEFVDGTNINHVESGEQLYAYIKDVYDNLPEEDQKEFLWRMMNKAKSSNPNNQ